MKQTDNLYERTLLSKMKEGDKTAFSYIFTVYYTDLVMFATTITKDLDTSKEIVQNVFVKFWEEREFITITTSLKSYLLKTVQNKSIDWLRHLEIRNRYNVMFQDNSPVFENDVENYIFMSELEDTIENTLIKLPDDIAETFRLNRYEGLKYHEIAKKLDVSVRTIEVRMSKALYLLQKYLRDYLVIFAALWLLIRFYLA